MKTPPVASGSAHRAARVPSLLCVLILLVARSGRADCAPASAPARAPVVRRIAYDVRLEDHAARVAAQFEVEAPERGRGIVGLLEGDVAIGATEFPSGLELQREGRCYQLVVRRPGVHRCRLEFAAKTVRTEPWHEARFLGPPAGIATVTAASDGGATEVELLAGTPLELPPGDTASLRGVLGGVREVALRWRGKAAESSRQVVVTCDTTTTLRATPGVLQFTSELRYHLPQGSVGRFTVALPSPQALTRVEGDQIRDWQVVQEGERALLRVELVRPGEKTYTLRLHSEQPVESLPFEGQVQLPEPREVDRETGLLLVHAQDVRLVATPLAGWQQVSATPDALAAYRFHGRPATLGLRLSHLEPLLRLADDVQARLEDHRLLVEHRLDLMVEQGGLYTLDLGPLGGAAVIEVQTEGLEDWQVRDDHLRLSFRSRVTGQWAVTVRLEQAHRTFPEQIQVKSLAVVGADRQTARISVGTAPGIQLKTAGLDGLREIPLHQLATPGETVLAYQALRSGWTLSLTAEQLAPRVVAEVFNLVTIGEGIVGGSATVRYAILNQGVQEFRLRVPSTWRNVDFTGLNIRRKDQATEVWRITLQDKVWGGYTLVITYDEPFDPHRALLRLGGLHALGVERETGSLAVTSAGGLQLRETRVAGPLERIDETELAPADRALITRSVLLAYRYGDAAAPYDLAVEASRFDSAAVLAAVADRTQLTTVVTEDGQMLTQATFMVKNHDKQFQAFTLPAGARLWSVFVNAASVKAEQQGETLLVPLPRGVDRDQAFSVELVYAQQTGSFRRWRPGVLALVAPATDVQTTYAEWEVFTPSRGALRGFGGTMRVTGSTTYSLGDAWFEFTTTYRDLVKHHVGVLVFAVLLVGVAAFITAAVRRGLRGVVTVLGVLTVFVVLAGMLLPALAKAKAKAQGMAAVNSLKQIGLAARAYSTDNRDTYPASLEQMRAELGTEMVTIDPQTGRRFVFLGALVSQITPDAVLAYAPEPVDGIRTVCLADGSVQQVSEEKFNAMLQHTLALATGQPQPAAPAQPTVTPGMVTVPMVQPRLNPPAEAGELPLAVGVRPIRIELPRSGRRLLFTKILNVQREPLSLQATVLPAGVWAAGRSALQMSTFLLGLTLAWRQWRRPRPSSLTTTCGAALVMASVTSLLLSCRLLGAVLIVVVPALILVGLVCLLPRHGRRLRSQSLESATDTADGAPGVSSATSLLIVAVLGSTLVSGRASQAPDPARTPEPPARITSAAYVGRVGERVAQIEAQFTVRSTVDDCLLPLLNDDVAVQEFSADTRGVRLVRQAGQVAALLPREGETVLRLRGVVKTGGEVPRRQLVFGIPPALVSRVTVALNEPDATVVFPAAVTCATRTAGSHTEVEALLGAAERVELSWTPKVKRATDITATVFCRNVSRVSFAAGVQTCRAELEYQVTQGELRELRVRVPPGHRVLRVEPEEPSTWHLEETSPASPSALAPGAELRVDLRRNAAPACRLLVETERSLDRLPEVATVEIPHAAGVKRETGWLGLQCGEELGLSVEAADGLQKIDATEFAPLHLEAEPVDVAYRFPRPRFRLQVRVETLEPLIEAHVRHLFCVDVDELRLASRLEYSIQRAGVFAVKLGIPEGYRVEKIALVTDASWSEGSTPPGPALSWSERRDAGRRQIDVTLPARVLGRLRLAVDLTRPLEAGPAELAVLAVVPLDAAKLAGHVVVAAEPGVQVKTRSFEGVTEVPASAVADGVGGLAFKLPAGGPDACWQLTLALERVESWVRAEVANWLTLGEGLASGRAIVRYDVQNAPAREFRLRVPEGLRNVEVQAPNLRRRDRQGNEWRLELQHRVTGITPVIVTWDQPFTLAQAGQESPLAFAGIEAVGVERQTGFVAIRTRTQMVVATPSPSADLLRVDTQDLPEWAGRPDSSTALAFRYLRPGYQLLLAARRFDPAEVLQALVDEARLTTVVAEDGQLMTELVFSVRNNGRQFLEVRLPEGAEVWSAFVNHQPVRPGLRGGRLLIPLEGSAGTTSSLPVQLTYVGASPFPRHKGRVILDSPAVDLPIKNARWELYLPPDFEYAKFGGTMNHELDAPRLVGAFSIDEYSQVESAKRREQEQQVASSIRDLKSKLAKGELEGASRAYGNMARRYGPQDGQATLKAVEQELRQAQRGNLKRAQDDLVVNNRLGDLAGGGPPPVGSVNYDDAVAEQQWARVQQAQEVTGLTARPLRVNVPTRGLRFTFSQALQMEGAKPLRLEFRAASTRTVNWPGRAALGAVCFVCLWAAIAGILQRRARSTTRGGTFA